MEEELAEGEEKPDVVPESVCSKELIETARVLLPTEVCPCTLFLDLTPRPPLSFPTTLGRSLSSLFTRSPSPL
jgi:hypothetical protein